MSRKVVPADMRTIKGSVIATSNVPALSAELLVLSAGTIEYRFTELARAFEKKSGYRVFARFSPSGKIVRWVEAGEPCDVVVVASEKEMQGLIDKGRVSASTRVTLAKAVIGVAVREGAPTIELSSSDSLKRAMLKARRFAHTNPAAGSSSGAHVEKIIHDLGLTESVKDKILMRDRGQATIRAVAEGFADFVIAQSTEIAAVKGVQYLGPLPPSLQSENLIQAAMCIDARMPSAAKPFIRHLVDAKKHWRDLGLVDP